MMYNVNMPEEKLFHEYFTPSVGKAIPMSRDWGVCANVCRFALDALEKALGPQLEGTGAHGADVQSTARYASTPVSDSDGYKIMVTGGVTGVSIEPISIDRMIYHLSLGFWIQLDSGRQSVSNLIDNAWIDDSRKSFQLAALAECALRALYYLKVSLPGNDGGKIELDCVPVTLVCDDLTQGVHISVAYDIVVSNMLFNEFVKEVDIVCNISQRN